MMRLDGYIDYNQDRDSGFESGLRCLPVDGIFPDNSEIDEDPGTQPLVDYASDSADDGYDGLESLQHLITYWKPEDGDISILPRMYANEISKLTGTDLFARPAEKRYRLINGDFHRALQKVSNLEPLLVSQTQTILLSIKKLMRVGINQAMHDHRIYHGKRKCVDLAHGRRQMCD